MPLSHKEILSFLFILLPAFVCTQIPAERILTSAELFELLDEEKYEGLREIKKVFQKGKKELAEVQLADYFKEAFSERYYFSWKKFEERFNTYEELYPGEREDHFQRAEYFQSRYLADTKWQLPFTNQLGEEVTAYRLRHLARQHKAVDMALASFYRNDQATTISYFATQVRSLNQAFTNGEYERQNASGGNGVYEVFRAGYRVLNWLLIHNMYLSQTAYQPADQLEMIKTLLHHGAQLNDRTPTFKYGNHQTRGLSALALIAIMLPEFEGTDQWYQHAMNLLEQHLEKEINPDGFQFERSVHYHMSDIDNYFYVYQLAQLNNLEVSPIMEHKLQQLFTTLVKIAQPDRHAPVLQDDTEEPWAEFNYIDKVMTLGAILFDDPTIFYFAADKVEAFKYWFVRQEQIEALKTRKKTKPELGSIALETTGYYVMRNGWNINSQFMIISAGLDENKPSHQHGDMLGLVAYANGNEILPNYQVRYFLPDYSIFKNSWVKNVAIVDSILHGKEWEPNSGGSGYGQWEELPQPKVIAWYAGDKLDYFAGAHNGYEDIGVDYQREVIFIKDGFWIVRDFFQSPEPHTYQQIWQGHFDEERKGRHIRATFQNGAGLEVILLDERCDSISYGSNRGKGRAVFNKTERSLDGFTTLLYSFEGFETRIPAETDLGKFKLKNWEIINSRDGIYATDNWTSDASNILHKENSWVLLDASFFEYKGKRLAFSKATDLYLDGTDNTWEVLIMGRERVNLLETGLPGVSDSRKELKPGDLIKAPN